MGDVDAKERGRRLRAARDAKGLTQQALAARVGCRSETISRHERGVFGGIDMALARRIADELGADVEHLFEGLGAEPAPDSDRSVSDDLVERIIVDYNMSPEQAEIFRTQRQFLREYVSEYTLRSYARDIVDNAPSRPGVPPDKAPYDPRKR